MKLWIVWFRNSAYGVFSSEEAAWAKAREINFTLDEAPWAQVTTHWLEIYDG